MQIISVPTGALKIKEANSAGQSWDIQGTSLSAEADSETVQELVSRRASVVDGVENAKDPNISEVATRQAPKGKVPEEYRDGGWRAT